MKSVGGAWATRVLMVSVAVLLPAGVLAASMAGPPASTTIAAGDRAGAASIGAEALSADDVPSTTAASTPTSTTVAPATTTTTHSTTVRATPRTTATTIVAPASTAPTTAVRTASTVTTTTNKAQQSSWYGEDRGFTVRWTMQPAAPRVGEPVAFTVSMSQFHGCCLASVQFDDGVRASPLEVFSRCDDTGTTRGTSTRTFAAPGYYGVYLSGQTFPCAPEDGLAPTDPMDPRSMRAVSFRACIEVAPRPGEQAAVVGEPGCPATPIRFPF
ncbi:MAG TPA: hypothetical protein VNT52_03815 [Acidimicrobiales bacterium]|nr:hypothetical protein [Acidimicrobiales bacterium]